MTRSYTTRHVDVGAATLALDEWPGEGRTVLFLHGTGLARGVWRPAAALLAGDCRPVALDFRGHGGSSRPDAPFDWSLVVDDVLRLAEIEGWRELVIAGHSLGGGIAVLTERARPDLVAGLVLIEPPLRPGGQDVASNLLERVRKRRTEWPSRDEAEAWFRDRAPYATWHPDAFAGFADTGIRDVGDGAELACPREVEISVFEHTDLDLIWRRLTDVQCPVWVGRGSGNAERQSGTASAVADWPRLGFDRVAEGAGHFAPLERPHWVAAVVREALGYLDGSGEGAS